MSEFVPVKIEEIIDEGRDTKTFRFDNDYGYADKDTLKPGRFLTAWLPDTGTAPFSFSYGAEDEAPGITVHKFNDEDEEEKDRVGRPVRSFTSVLFDKEVGDTLHVSYPRGNSFSKFKQYDRKCYIGGGCGAPPLAFLAESDINKYGFDVFLLGAKTDVELLFEDRIKKAMRHEDFNNVFVSTDDGSYGQPGRVTELIKQVDLRKGATTIYICGPEAMMKAAADMLVEDGHDPRDILILMERYMKCGIGLCGSCDCGGRRVCVDGPVFAYSELQDTEFGTLRRERSGLYVPIVKP